MKQIITHHVLRCLPRVPLENIPMVLSVLHAPAHISAPVTHIFQGRARYVLAQTSRLLHALHLLMLCAAPARRIPLQIQPIALRVFAKLVTTERRSHLREPPRVQHVQQARRRLTTAHFARHVHLAVTRQVGTLVKYAPVGFTVLLPTQPQFNVALEHISQVFPPVE